MKTLQKHKIEEEHKLKNEGPYGPFGAIKSPITLGEVWEGIVECSGREALQRGALHRPSLCGPDPYLQEKDSGTKEEKKWNTNLPCYRTNLIAVNSRRKKKTDGHQVHWL